MSPPRTGTPASAEAHIELDDVLQLDLSRQRQRHEQGLRPRAADAARSLMLTAAARNPSSRQESQSIRKWTPSTSASWVTTSPPASSGGVGLVPPRSARATPARASRPSSPPLRELHRPTALSASISATPRITATPAAPARMHSAAFDASMPPMATDGDGDGRGRRRGVRRSRSARLRRASTASATPDPHRDTSLPRTPPPHPSPPGRHRDPEP